MWDARTDPRTDDDVLADLRSREQQNPNDAEREQSKVDQAAGLAREWLGSGWMPVKELEGLAQRVCKVGCTTARR